jgi:hypothetical protein
MCFPSTYVGCLVVVVLCQCWMDDIERDHDIHYRLDDYKFHLLAFSDGYGILSGMVRFT